MKLLHQLKICSILLILLSFGSASAQNDSEASNKIQALLQKTKGKKFIDSDGTEQKIVDQSYNPNSIKVILSDGSLYSPFVSDYYNINWSGFTYTIESTQSDKISVLKIILSTKATHKYYLKDDSADAETASVIQVYILTKDVDAVKSILNAHTSGK